MEVPTLTSAESEIAYGIPFLFFAVDCWLLVAFHSSLTAFILRLFCPCIVLIAGLVLNLYPELRAPVLVLLWQLLIAFHLDSITLIWWQTAALRWGLGLPGGWTMVLLDRVWRHELAFPEKHGEKSGENNGEKNEEKNEEKVERASDEEGNEEKGERASDEEFCDWEAGSKDRPDSGWICDLERCGDRVQKNDYLKQASKVSPLLAKRAQGQKGPRTGPRVVLGMISEAMVLSTFAAGGYLVLSDIFFGGDLEYAELRCLLGPFQGNSIVLFVLLNVSLLWVCTILSVGGR